LKSFSRVFLACHGVTDANARRLTVGHTNICLNQHGMRQASEVARRLATVVDMGVVILSSPLLRAVATANCIAKATESPLFTRLDLRGRSYGNLELAGQEEVLAHRRALGLQTAEPILTWPKGSGPEASPSLAERASRTLRRVASDREDFVLVTHAGWIRAACDEVVFGGSSRVYDIRMGAGCYIQLISHDDGEWEIAEIWHNPVE
jgi:probable phosphoglycerate mutase